MQRPSRHFLALLLATGLTGPALATPLAAQFDGRSGRPGPGGIVVGARGGYDFKGDAPLLGAFLRTSLAWRLALQGTGDFTFLDGLTERQAGVDLLFAAAPGMLLGGGPVVRNTVFGIDFDSPRDTKVGYTFVALFGGTIGGSRLTTGLEVRYTKVDDFDSQVLSLQFGVPILRW